MFPAQRPSGSSPVDGFIIDRSPPRGCPAFACFDRNFCELGAGQARRRKNRQVVFAACPHHWQGEKGEIPVPQGLRGIRGQRVCREGPEGKISSRQRRNTMPCGARGRGISPGAGPSRCRPSVPDSLRMQGTGSPEWLGRGWQPAGTCTPGEVYPTAGLQEDRGVGRATGMPGRHGQRSEKGQKEFDNFAEI